MSRIIWISPNCSSALNTWKLAGLRFKVEKLEKRWVVYFFLQIPSSWRLFYHQSPPSVFCILCKSPFGEMVQFRLTREKTPCKLKTFEKSRICNLISNQKFIWIWHNWTKDWKWNFYSPTKLWSSSIIFNLHLQKNLHGWALCDGVKTKIGVFLWYVIWIWNGDWVQIWDMHHWCSPTQDSEELIERRHLYFKKRNWSHLYCTFHCHWLAYLYRQDLLKTKPDKTINTCKILKYCIKSLGNRDPK